MLEKILTMLLFSTIILCQQHLLPSSPQLQKPLNTQQSQTQDSNIYGMRWFLGESYQYNLPDQNHTNQTFPTSKNDKSIILMFNTYDFEYTPTMYVKFITNTPNINAPLSQQLTQCTYKSVLTNITVDHHLKINQYASQIGQTFTTNIYKCFLNISEFIANKKITTVQYVIYSKQKSHSNNNDHDLNTVKKTENMMVQYQATLRIPNPTLQTTKILTVGDWGLISEQSKSQKKYIPIDQCLASKIIDPSIKLMLLLGDLAYDLEGQSYITFLEYLQPYSQEIVMIFTPGNHETGKHEDLFILIQQSFYSPNWSQFSGYFDLIQYGQYILLGYNPDLNFDTFVFSALFEKILQPKYENLQQIMKQQLMNGRDMKKQWQNLTIILYSHYPIYCSQNDIHQNCTLYRTTLDWYLKYFQEIGIDFYISGHLHFYERTKPICNDSFFIEPLSNQQMQAVQQLNSNQSKIKRFYHMNRCPIYLIQGAGGNNYYVQMRDLKFSLKNFSQTFIEGTGFGILTLRNSKRIKGPLDFTSKISTKIQYRHYSSQKCLVTDSFAFLGKANGSNDSIQSKILIITLSLFAFGSFIFLTRNCKRKKLNLQKRRSSTRSSIELHQQNFNDDAFSDHVSEVEEHGNM